MGLILGPLVILWLVMAIYAVNIGYTLFAALPSHAAAVLVSITSLLCLVCYLYWGFSRYKAKTALSWYEIPLTFASHKPSLGVCILAVAVHWVGPNPWVSEYANILTSSIMFITRHITINCCTFDCKAIQQGLCQALADDVHNRIVGILIIAFGHTLGQCIIEGLDNPCQLF